MQTPREAEDMLMRALKEMGGEVKAAIDAAIRKRTPDPAPAAGGDDWFEAKFRGAMDALMGLFRRS
jgi:hypothetical protein